MRILFDSKKQMYKDPFGTLTPGQACRLHIHIPTQIRTTGAECRLCKENGQRIETYPLTLEQTQGSYDIFSGTMTISEPGLYFYHFFITTATGSFRLFKYGDDTNMEEGSCWQVSCIPESFTTPEWAKGAVIYQIFPDRFAKKGLCDLKGKLQPYLLHENWDEEVFWQPDEKGRVLNNDFYGGNFAGITEKLPYIASLGVNILYLNPISKSFSSHRYDTGDYKTPDPMLGTKEDFARLCDEAHKLGMKVILDGVFSHTGSNSLYFDKERTFGGQGAYCRHDSAYFSWYMFHNYPNSYKSWWGFDTLPTVNKQDPGFIRYIITDEDSVVAHWLKLGADGFRLDVADELPDSFIRLLKQRLRQIKPDALLIGEVWEDASNKIAYDQRRRYFVDEELDSCMNYPFRTAIVNFLLQKDDGRELKNQVLTLLENYPQQVVFCNMNMLGTHDTPRILTALVDDYDGPRQELARRFLTHRQEALAKERLRAASFLQFMLPGAPSIYYGDEAGMQGHKDPFNRRTFPWGKEDTDLQNHFKALGALRAHHPALRVGSTEFTCAEGGRLCFYRCLDGACLQIYVNQSRENWLIPTGRVLLSHRVTESGKNLQIAPMGFMIIEKSTSE